MFPVMGPFTLLAALSFAVSTLASGHPTQSAVALFLEFEHPAPPAIVSSMEAEVDRILSPSGLEFEWHALSDAQSTATFADLAVAHFKGACGIHSESVGHRLYKPVALATTAVSDGHVLPFTEIECGTICRFLGPDLQALPSRDREAALGRAMGRVLAHELYHIFGATRKHATRGVASAYHSRDELLAPEFNFREEESDMFRSFHDRITGTLSQPESTR
jgi:hypothetical protein